MLFWQINILDYYFSFCECFLSRALYGVTTETTSFPMKASEILDPRLACEGVDITESTKPVTVFPLQVFNCSKQEVLLSG